MAFRACLSLAVLAVLVPVLQGCVGPGYYADSLSGHVQILAARKKVDVLAEDPRQPADLRAKMALARDIRRFASESLGLPDNRSYTTYVDIGRDDVTVAVFAAPEFSLAPLTWCFPVFGCVPYRGFFSHEDARDLARRMGDAGHDVHMVGVTAYSTLGWTPDPLISTMFRHDEAHLAAVVFHELAHQRLYVRNDTAFNEAYAVAVEVTGVRKWFASRGDDDSLARYEADERRAADFRKLIADARTDLAEIYAGPESEARKRAAKAAAIERLRANYRRLRDTRWGGYAGYDRWFDAPINNAKLASVSVYGAQVPAFLALFDLCGQDHERFHAAVEALAALGKEQRGAALAAARTCP